ncbi:hypothetical protein BD410DRAFT_889013 [Rickenella mellea]|uniref:Uncharacterized protein n=1 Tax=Rickenella mellea TaxID=50990 RepID=A0A4Y7PMT4_9AGAM|nr:hypothetical protein BD410DRAFT_889013 [Rickenella mellea]
MSSTINNSEQTPVTGILVTPFTSKTWLMKSSASIEQAVACLQFNVAKLASDTFALSPVLKPVEMQSKYYPALDPTKAVGDTSGLTALVSPSELQNLRIKQFFEGLKSSDKGEQMTQSAAIDDQLKPLLAAIQDLQAKLKDVNARADAQEERADAQEERADALEAKADAMKAQLDKEKAERQDEIAAIRRLTLLITPLHLRVLLDMAQQKILEHLKADSWEDFRAEKNLSQLVEDVFEKLSGHCHLSREAILFLCSYNDVRKAGNKAAHTAKQEEIRNAVLTKPLERGERRHLEQIFEFTFGETV